MEYSADYFMVPGQVEGKGNFFSEKDMKYNGAQRACTYFYL
jgi:hypothetical protein